MNFEEKIVDIMASGIGCSGVPLYPCFADDDDPIETPYMVYIVYSNVRDYTVDTEVDVVVRVQVSCFSDSYAEARDLKNAVIRAFETAQLADTSIALYDADEQNFYEKDTKLYHCIADLRVWFNG